MATRPAMDRRDANRDARVVLSRTGTRRTRCTCCTCCTRRPTPAGRLYVTNENSGDLSVIDTATRQVVATIPLGKRPRGIKVSPDGATLYVALSGSPIAPPGTDESKLPPPDRNADGIGVVDVKQGKLLRVIHGGSDPEQTGRQPGRPLVVRRQRRCGTDQRDRDQRRPVVATFRSAASRKALTCVPTARSSTSRRKRTTRSR